MKDLDFDELDRAVNSLMTNVPKSAPATDDTGEKVVDITPTLDDKQAPSLDQIKQATDQTVSAAAASSIPVPAPTTPASPVSTPQRPAAPLTPATRRGGRFMDVVHPSSDMKKPTDTVRPVSRQGVTVQPRENTMATPEPANDSVVPSADTPSTQAPAAPAPVGPTAAPVTSTPSQATEHATPVSEWPDPLDMASFKDKESDAEKPTDTPPVASDGAVEKESTPAVTNDMPDPLTSPFLPGAKVEKRPLGGNSDAATQPDSDNTPLPESNKVEEASDPNVQLPAEPTGMELALPEELQGDLMAIEADTSHQQNVDKAKEQPQAAEPQKNQAKEEKQPEKPDEPAKTPEPATPPAEEKPAPTGPASIPQQYREEPSTGDKENGAIYDTDSYHKPLAHPAKKKTGWLWVLWILVILLVGAGAGAAVYFLGLV